LVAFARRRDAVCDGIEMREICGPSPQCEMYERDAEFKKYPKNWHVRDKIRQQLQVFRDKGFLEFLGSGTYRLT
jgi:hypothetical protein